MKHSTARELALRQALHGRLDPADESVLRLHLSSCKQCAAFNASISPGGRDILPVPPPRASFEQDIFRTIMQETAQSPGQPLYPPLRRTTRLRPLLAVAASIPAILVSVFLARGVLTPPELPLSSAPAREIRAGQPADPATRAVTRATGLPESDISLSVEQGTRRISIPAQPASARREPVKESRFRSTDAEGERFSAELPRPSIIREEDKAKTDSKDSLALGATSAEEKLALGMRATTVLKAEHLSTNAKKAGSSRVADAGSRPRPINEDKTARSMDSTPPRLILQPTATVRIHVPDEASARIVGEMRAQLAAELARLMPAGTMVSILPAVRPVTQAPAVISIPGTNESAWRTIVLVLWLLFETAVRILNVIAGAAHRSRTLGRLDTALGAVLGTLWLPVILVRVVASSGPARKRD